MRLKVLFAAVIGLLAAVLTTMPQVAGGGHTGWSVALQAATAARTHGMQEGAGNHGSKQAAAAAKPIQAVNCALIVPADPLSAGGLATPWRLVRDGAAPCNESDPGAAAFVEAAIFDPATGQVSVYSPLVVDAGSRPAITPTTPALPAGAVVGIWVGYNGDNLVLRGPGRASCIGGVEHSAFGQNAFCNATAFFEAAHQAIRAGRLAVPALGTAKDGKPCPTARDFSVVDQDQSDNTTTRYLVTADGRLAQETPANVAALAGATVAKNGSDEALLSRGVGVALGCTQWTVPNLADEMHQQRSTAWALNELMASVRQAPPVALVPAGDPFVFIGDQASLTKLNAYRAGVDQPQVASLAEADTTPYCRSLLSTGLARIAADRQFTEPAASPFPADASNLFNFLALRFNQTFSNGDGFLHCEQLLGVRNPVQLQMTGDVVTGAVIDLHPAPAQPQGAGAR
jgi:hypothetical protein